MTHRQFVVWQVWLDEQLYEPSRTDLYIARVAAEVQRTILKDKQKGLPISEFIIKKPKKMTKEEIEQDAKMRRGRLLRDLGGSFGIRQPDGSVIYPNDPPKPKQPAEENYELMRK